MKVGLCFLLGCLIFFSVAHAEAQNLLVKFNDKEASEDLAKLVKRMQKFKEYRAFYVVESRVGEKVNEELFYEQGLKAAGKPDFKECLILNIGKAFGKDEALKLEQEISNQPKPISVGAKETEDTIDVSYYDNLGKKIKVISYDKKLDFQRRVTFFDNREKVFFLKNYFEIHLKEKGDDLNLSCETLKKNKSKFEKMMMPLVGHMAECANEDIEGRYSREDWSWTRK